MVKLLMKNYMKIESSPKNTQAASSSNYSEKEEQKCTGNVKSFRTQTLMMKKKASQCKGRSEFTKLKFWSQVLVINLVIFGQLNS